MTVVNCYCTCAIYMNMYAHHTSAHSSTVSPCHYIWQQLNALNQSIAGIHAGSINQPIHEGLCEHSPPHYPKLSQSDLRGWETLHNHPWVIRSRCCRADMASISNQADTFNKGTNNPCMAPICFCLMCITCEHTYLQLPLSTGRGSTHWARTLSASTSQHIILYIPIETQQIIASLQT